MRVKRGTMPARPGTDRQASQPSARSSVRATISGLISTVRGTGTSPSRRPRSSGTWKTTTRTVSIEDIEHFAEFTGDKFYAHMDEEAAKASPIFEGRVAHGYLILSFAAGLFVWPDPGPVLANTGLENLRFLTPIYPGDSLRVELTVRAKSIKSEETGQVRWAVEVFNQDDELVATYDLLTENVP